jgi:transcriptional regulator with XRE-family HTH domain
MSDHTIGASVRKARDRTGLTQREFAKKIGVTRMFVCYVENDRKNPSMELLRRVAKVTGTELRVEFRETSDD